MPKINKNNINVKRIPFTSVFNTEIVRKLSKWADREERGQFIDYRTPLYANKAGSKVVIQPNARISGIKGYLPTDRVKLVETFFRNVIVPNIKNPDFYE